jgi:hypothetical protein
MYFRNVCIYLRVHTASQPEQHSWHLLPLKSQEIQARHNNCHVIHMSRGFLVTTVTTETVVACASWGWPSESFPHVRSTLALHGNCRSLLSNLNRNGNVSSNVPTPQCNIFMKPAAMLVARRANKQGNANVHMFVTFMWGRVSRIFHCQTTIHLKTCIRNSTNEMYIFTFWSRNSSKYYLRIQSVPQRELRTSSLQTSTG